MLVASLGMGVRLLGVGLKLSTSTDTPNRASLSGRAAPLWRSAYYYSVGSLLLVLCKREHAFGRPKPSFRRLRIRERSRSGRLCFGKEGEQVRIMTLRMLVLTLLVVMFIVLPISTPPAEASGFDEAQRFAEYLCETYWWCG